jgi:hypothetical protein
MKEDKSNLRRLLADMTFKYLYINPQQPISKSKSAIFKKNSMPWPIRDYFRNGSTLEN